MTLIMKPFTSCQALKVLQNVLFKHGTYEKFAKQSGGRELTREQILELVMGYLKEEGLEDEVVVKLSPDLVSRACMTRVKGRPLLQVQTNNVHEGWMDGLLRHEIGEGMLSTWLICRVCIKLNMKKY